ncbi:MAG: bacterial transcriptional activator domain-containing protein [Nitriliruptorales bacterium]|nr:bacterial transcriptional activator domain-containing protein [Nitriliruptorales bacterium]
MGEDDLVGADGCYWLHLPDGTRVDVEVALQAALVAEQHVEHDPTLAKTQAITALDLTSRPFLPGVHGPWVQSTRDRLARSRARALRALASLHLRTGDPDRAVRAARDAVEIEPLQEVNARLLMRAHNASGERAQALRVYERYRTHLAAELGVDPSRRTRNLHLQLLKG